MSTEFPQAGVIGIGPAAENGASGENVVKE